MKSFESMVGGSLFVTTVVVAVMLFYFGTGTEPRVMLDWSVQIESVVSPPPEISTPDSSEKSGKSLGSGTVIGHIAYNFGKGWEDEATHSLILTAAHVIGSASSVNVYWKGERMEGIVFALDATSDLALIKVSRKLPYAEMFFSSLVTGERQWIVGNSYGQGLGLSDGYIGEIKDIEKGIRRGTAPVWFGNSGGGTFVYRHGRYVLVGVVDMVFVAPLARGFAIANTVQFFITTDKIKEFLTNAKVL